MAAIWPASLPQEFTVEGYQEVFPDNRIISPMSAGPPKFRSKGSGPPQPLKGVNYMTTTQVATFWTFYYTTLINGTQPFDRTHPRTLVTKEWHFIGLPVVTFAGFKDGEKAWRVAYDYIVKGMV